MRVDQPQLMRVIELAFRDKAPLQKLWPMSPGTFRQRFAKLTKQFGLDKLQDHRIKPLDLGSLRAGGATWLLQTAENGELVRRRGRWLNQRIMEIYVQEVSSVLFLSKLPAATSAWLLEPMRWFPYMLEKAEFFKRSGYPSTTWFSGFSCGPRSSFEPGLVGKDGCGRKAAKCLVNLMCGGAEESPRRWKHSW